MRCLSEAVGYGFSIPCELQPEHKGAHSGTVPVAVILGCAIGTEIKTVYWADVNRAKEDS